MPSAPPVAGAGSGPAAATAEDVVRRYDSSIVVRRWGATVVDYVLLVGGIALSMSVVPEDTQGAGLAVAGLLVLGYFPVLERFGGRTIGKMLCRVHVVNRAGGPPSWSQVVVRTLLRLLEVNPVLLGGIPAGIAVLASKTRQRLGDMAAGTFVVRSEDLAYLRSPGPGRAPAPLPALPAGSAPVGDANWLAPTNRSGWAIAAGYLGLFAVLLAPAPFALGAGLLAIRDLQRDPRLGGRGRAIFGIAMGSLFTALLIVLLAFSFLRAGD